MSTPLVWSLCIMVGLGFTLGGAFVAARPAMPSEVEISDKLDMTWKPEDDFGEGELRALRRATAKGMWLIAAGTFLQMVGTAGQLLGPW